MREEALGSEGDEGGKADQDVPGFGGFECGEEGRPDEDKEEEETEDGASGGGAAKAKRAPEGKSYVENIQEEKEDGDALVHGVFLMHIAERKDIAGDRYEFDARGKPDADGAAQGNGEICAQRAAGGTFAGELGEDGVFFRGEGEVLVVHIEDGGDTSALLGGVDRCG